MPADQLKREGSPPTGYDASPEPQWWDPTDGWSKLFRQRTRDYATGQVTVGTSEVELVAGASALVNRIGLKVKALATNDDVVYIIETGGSTSTGYALLPGEEAPPFSFDAANAVAVYAISGSAGQKVSVIEEA